MARPKQPTDPKTCPVPVRFDDRTKGRISRAARRLGSSSSAVVRFAVLRGLDEIETGTITLPKPRR